MFASLAPLEDAVQAGYLARLDVDAGPPSAEALQLIVRRQAERIPYETLWIQSGELWDIDPATAAQRLATTSRGGYCYHLNGALGMLLHSLGYQVHGHVGGVHSSDTPGSDEIGNHLVLTVTGLPTTANPEGIWYVDTGLGDALHEPVPLEPGTFSARGDRPALGNGARCAPTVGGRSRRLTGARRFECAPARRR